MTRSLSLSVLLVACVCAGASADRYGDYCRRAADAGAGRLDAATGLVRDAAGQPDVARLTPGWVLACVSSGAHATEAAHAAQSVAGAVGRTGPTAGLLPWSPGGVACLAATEVAAPPLCAAVLKGEALPAAGRDALAPALKAMAAALGRAKPESPDLRRLTFAAACAALGEATGEAGLLAAAEKLVGEWLAGARQYGLVDGHGPTTEAYRLAALQWIRAFAGRTTPAWVAAWQLLWADLAQRLEGPTGPLAGAELFSVAPDCTDGSGPLRWMLPMAFSGLEDPVGSPVGLSALDAAYFALPFAEPIGTRLPAAPKPPATLTYTWATAPLLQETTYLGDGFSLGTMTGPVATGTVPLLLTWPGLGAGRSTSYLYASCPGDVAALQADGLAVLNFDFDDVGTAERRQVYTEIILGRREAVTKVAVSGRPWNGQTMAVDELAPVAVEVGGRRLGVIISWCGPADASELTERVKPGVLYFTGDGPEGELALRIYGRQADYVLPRPEDDYVVGMLVTAGPAEGDFAPWAWSLRAYRYKKYLQVVKHRVPSQDEGHPILDRYKPKPKRAYAVDTAENYTLTWTAEKQKWSLTMDLRRGQAGARSVGDQAVAEPTMQFDTPLVKRPLGGQEFQVPAEVAAAVGPR